jgi:hypothetical protein
MEPPLAYPHIFMVCGVCRMGLAPIPEESPRNTPQKVTMLHTIIPGCSPTGPLPTNTSVKVYMPRVEQGRMGELVRTGLTDTYVTGTITRSQGGEHTLTTTRTNSVMTVPDDGRVVINTTYGACGVEGCEECRPLFDENDNPIPGT